MTRHHRTDREARRRKGRDPRKGFSLIELAVAMTAFLVFATAATIVVAQTQLTKAVVRAETSVRDELSRLVGVAGTAPFVELATGRFTRPDACTTNPTTSCVTVAGRDLVVSWQSEAGEDLLGLSLESAVSVELTATTTVAGLGAVTVTHTVINPTPGGLDGAGIVRVGVTGTYGGALYLVTSEGVLAGGGGVTNGESLIRISPGVCTAATPCRLALSPDGDGFNSTYTLDASFASAGGSIRVGADEIVDASARIAPRAHLRVKLTAENDNGAQAAPNVPGSVCLWLSTSDGSETGACNDDDARYVTFDRYDKNGTDVALGVGQKVSIGADRRDGTCPSLSGMVGVIGGNWVSRAVCTSHTWGLPYEMRTSSSSDDATSTFSLGAASFVELLWREQEGLPAAGYTGEPLWSFPRDAAACSTTASCTTTDNGNETEDCPAGTHCLSSRNVGGYVSAPLVGSRRLVGRTVADGAGATPFTISFADADHDGADPQNSVTITALPTVGTLSNGGGLLSVDDTIATFGANGSANLTYTPPANYTYTTFKVRIDDGSSSGVRTVTFVLSDGGSHPLELETQPFEVAQGGAASAQVTVVGSDGDVLAGAEVTATWPTGMTGAATATSDTSGVAVFSAAGGTAARGARTVTFGLGSLNATATATVSPRVGTITVTAADTAQSRRSTVSVTVADRAGDPLSLGVRLTISRDGGSRGVYVPTGGCYTNASGTCSTNVVTEVAAPVGTYYANAQAEGVSDSDTFIVEGEVGAIVVAPFNVGQGASSPLTVTVTDGAGNPIQGATVTVSGGGDGITVSLSGTTNASGVLAGTISASGSAVTGLRSLTLTSGNVRDTQRFTVLGVLADILVQSAVTAPQGGSSTVIISTVDGNGQPVNEVDLTASGGVTVSVSSRSDRYGKAELTVQPGRNQATGRYEVTVTSGSVSRSVTVSVTGSVGSLSAAGSVPVGGAGTLTVVVRDGNGERLMNTATTFRSLSSELNLAQSAGTTDAFGRLFITASSLKAGIYLIEVGAGSGTARVAVVVGS